MIDFSKHGAKHIRVGYDTVGRALFARFLSSLTSVPKNQDASNGKLKSALKSRKPLYVTSDLYMDYNRGASIQFFNVNTSGQDYRAVLGYDYKIVRVETLDAKAAEARTKGEAAYWAGQTQPPPQAVSLSADGDGFYNDDEEPDYNAVQPPEHPYGRP